jgi:hypothetical protein
MRAAKPTERQEVYVEALRALTGAVPFLVGGAYALFHYIGRSRPTKDMDVFIEPDELQRALGALRRAGFAVEVTDSAWLGKGRREGALIDLIFCSYNGLFPVDHDWFENARAANVLGVEVDIVGPEEILVSKAFVAARDRFDGADISWLIRAVGPALDWQRIEQLMGDHWQVLLWQLVHFLYVFPSERRLIPPELMGRLMGRLGRDLVQGPAESTGCRGPMLDPVLYWAEVDDPRPRRQLVAVHLGGAEEPRPPGS